MTTTQPAAAEVILWKTLTLTERNRIIAERVMGKALKCPGKAVTTWRKSPSRIIGEYLEFAEWHCSLCNQGESRIAPEEHDTPGEIPRYSESMDAAWQIVEKLYEQRYEVSLSTGVKPPNIMDHYSAQIWRRDPACMGCVQHILDHGVAYVDTSMPDAICVAALRCLGYEVAL